jgi:hypothetical protein
MADESLRPVAKVVAAVLLITFRNNKTLLCNPSYEAIAKHAGCSVRTAKRAINDLRAAGWLYWSGSRADQREYVRQYLCKSTA